MTPATLDGELAAALEAQRERLLPCVHCGFCLPACPTYNRLGDEADSPRGRLHLMGAVVEGRLSPDSDAFRTHIDRCLGCRACEPVCPSGVEYGTLLELARDVSRRSAPQPPLTRLLLGIFASERRRRIFFMAGRLLRGSRLAALGARLIPGMRRLHGARFGLAMLASTAPWKPPRGGQVAGGGHSTSPGPTTAAQPSANGAVTRPARRPRVGVLLGCVQEGLYARVNAATERVLRANGYDVVEVRGQGCCGALHAHGGVLDEARAMARANIEAFEYAAVEYVAVNAAGCGAAMKDYGVLLERDERWAVRARRFAASVRDVTELLASAGPRAGAPVSCRVAYDHPCHLLHAQGVRQAPLDVLAAVPALEVQIVEGADECCGGAGIYGITHPDLGGAIGADKVASVRRAGADAVATPNPGCMMQIGAGLRLEGAHEGVVHPIELLDESYRRAGYYDAE
jgi:glycolate oxidase iron-sulfur subunit